MKVLRQNRMISRAELALEQAKSDAKEHDLLIIMPHHGVFDLPDGLPVPKVDIVQSLVEQNQDIYDRLVSHPFPKSLANGTQSLDGFRFYMIQDKLYIENYVRVRMMSVAGSSDFDTVEAFVSHLPSSVKYAQVQNNVCVEQLSVPQDVINSTIPSQALIDSRAFYTEVAQNDNWFAMHIALLPCLLAYLEIAVKFLADPATVRNVIYHPLWTVLNADGSYVDAYRFFLNQNLASAWTPENERRWNEIFRRACDLEIRFFDCPKDLTSPYHIIPDGTYFIRSFRNGSVLSVAIRDQPLFKELFKDFKDEQTINEFGWVVPLPAQSVVGVPKTGNDNQKWKTIATSKGFTFQNVATRLYLGIRVVLRMGRVLRVVQASEKPYYWWINKVPSMPDQGTYQVFDSENLKYALQANLAIFQVPDFKHVFGALDTIRPDFPTFTLPATSIVAEDNFEGSDQMWLFDEVDSPTDSDSSSDSEA